jgi:hypothetical protein
MGTRRLPVVVLAVALAVSAHEAFATSPDRRPVPDPGPCDVVLTVADAPRLQSLLNDAALRVFCVEPGDYRSAGLVIVFASGTESERRYLRFHDSEVRPAIERTEQAIFESLRFRGSWWVIQGITLQPRTAARSILFLGIEGGDHNVVEYCLVDGIDYPAEGMHAGIKVAGYEGDPGTYNVIRWNVVRRGNQTRIPVDYSGVSITRATSPGEDNDFNQILDNEIYDWGDGIALQGNGEDCDVPGRAHGTLIDGNDIYITPDKRANCDGTPNPEGECSCSENAIDLKHDPGPDPALWTRITNNRTWGFRPTSTPSCGGSGSNGAAIQAGSICVGHVLVAGNFVGDSRMGIKPASTGWVIAGNLLYDVGRGIFPIPDTTELAVEFNTIVDADHAYDDNASHTTTRCNAVIDDLGADDGANPRGEDHESSYNYLYAASPRNFDGPTNELFVAVAESANSERCFWRKRWTDPELVCIPLAEATDQSPHAAAVPACGSVAGDFELAPFDFHSTLAVPEPDAAPYGAMLALFGSWRLARRRGARSASTAR